MNIQLYNSMPLFLKLICEEVLTEKEQHSLDFLRKQFEKYLYNYPDLDEAIEPLYYIYLGYCKDLVNEISDSEIASATYEFILYFYNSSKPDEIKVRFYSLAEAAYNSIYYYKIIELYDSLTEYYEEQEHLDIEVHRQLLAKMIQDDPNNIHLKSQNNLLYLLLHKWSSSPPDDKLSFVQHLKNIFEITKLFADLIEYPYLGKQLNLKLSYMWDEWFIQEYVAQFLIPKLNLIYNNSNERDAEIILDLRLNDSRVLAKTLQRMLLKSIDTCILKYAVHLLPEGHKRTKHANDFLVRNIGNINLMELNITILLLICKNQCPTMLTLERLNASIMEFISYARSQWIIDCHRFVIDITESTPSVNDFQNGVKGKLIIISQLLERCYYKKTGGRSIPAPPRIDHSLSQENIHVAKPRLMLS